MNKAMEVKEQNSTSNSFSTPDVLPPENHSDSLTSYTSRLGTVIPNRIFVGGLDYKVNEGDLQHFFSQHGTVKDVKIVIDHLGMSKGYGFVTFDTQEEALKILRDVNGICFKDKRLSIGQAVRKQQASQQTKSMPVASPNPAMPLPVSCGTFYLTTSTGYPYTYHNGVAYFHWPNLNPPAHPWPPAPPVMLPQFHQPPYQQPAYHQYQCVPNHCQWNVFQHPMSSSPVVYSQQSDYLHQPTDGSSVQPPLPAVDDTTPENPIFPHSQFHLKPKYHRYIYHQDCHCLPETTDPPDASVLPTSQPLM